jgi:hypothetical protein
MAEDGSSSNGQDVRSRSGWDPERRTEEDPKKRLDRELIELLNEARLALPGVQVLFAFLLVLPFQSRFDELQRSQRDVYVLALLSSAAAVALIIAPSSYHRLNFRRRVKERMLFLSNRLLIAGLALTVVAMGLAVALVVDVTLGWPMAGIAAIVTVAWCGWFWFVMPILAWREGTDVDGDEEG